MCRQAVSIDTPKTNGITSITVVGMGGSAIAGDILKDFTEETRIDVIRGYTVPKWVDNESLGIFISYSGNTEETLSAFESFSGKKIVITSNFLEGINSVLM